MLLLTGLVGDGSSAFVIVVCCWWWFISFIKMVFWWLLWFKCFCQISLLVVVVDQMPLSTGHVSGGASAFVNWTCGWWIKCLSNGLLMVVDQLLLSR